MKLQAHQRDVVIRVLSIPHGGVELRCDGYKVDAVVERVSKRGMSYQVVVYVDGMLEGKRLQKDDAVGAKFYPTHRRRLYSAAKRMEIERHVGKRAARRHFNLDAVAEYRMPMFRTALAFLKHIENHNDSIELVRPQTGGRD